MRCGAELTVHLDGSPAASTLTLGDGSGDPANDQTRPATYGDDDSDDVSLCGLSAGSHLTDHSDHAVSLLGRLDLRSQQWRQQQAIQP